MTLFTSFNRFVQDSQEQNPCAHHSSAIKQKTGFPFLCRMHCYTCTLLINFKKSQKPHILEHFQSFKFISTHLFHPVPLLCRFCLKKHILWRDSEDKCNVCNLILPSLIFKARTLQYHHIDLILYSSYEYFCKWGKPQEFNPGTFIIAYRSAPTHSDLSLNTVQLVTSAIIMTLGWTHKSQGTEKLWKGVHTSVVSKKNASRSYPYNQTTWNALTS